MSNASEDSSEIPQQAAADDLMATAFHEAGHAVMAEVLGRMVNKVTIAPGKSQFGIGRLGFCEVGKGRNRAVKDPLEDEALIMLAGMVAEARFTGEYCQRGAAEDLRAVNQLVGMRAETERQQSKLLRRLLDKTESLLDDEVNAKAVELVAAELIERTQLKGRSIRHFVNQARSPKK